MIKHHGAARTCRVRQVAKVIKHRLRPAATGVRELEHDTAAVAAAKASRATGNRSAVKIAWAIQGHTAIRILTLAVAVEAEHHALMVLSAAYWSQLENRTAVRRAASYGCTVSVAGCVKDQLRRGVRAIEAAREAVD